MWNALFVCQTACNNDEPCCALDICWSLHFHPQLQITQQSQTIHAVHNIRNHAGKLCLHFLLRSGTAALHLSYPLSGCVCSHQARLRLPLASEFPLRFCHSTSQGLGPGPRWTQWSSPLEARCQPASPRLFSPGSCYWSPSETDTSAPAVH